MKITTTPSELLAKGKWDEACDMLGINVWAVNEGQMDSGEELALTEDQGVELGLLPRRGEV